MKTIYNLILKGSEQKPIAVDISYNTSPNKKPLVVFVHGFKGFKDWGHFNAVASYFAERDFVFAKFNFSHNGTTLEKPLDFDDLEAFGNNNYLFELNDLESVLNALLVDEQLKNEINTEQVYLIGHSRGGAISIIKTAEDTRIKKLVTWAAVADIVNRNSQKTIETWKQSGVVHTYNGRTKQQMPLNVQFYETILANKDRLDIAKATKKINVPFLIIHGTNDEAVSLKDAYLLNEANEMSTLFVIEEANHTFGAKHPWEDVVLPEDAKLVIDRTIKFFREG
jgi:pimeloyl-ACP methyl ester carboxylesterase